MVYWLQEKANIRPFRSLRFSCLLIAVSIALPVAARAQYTNNFQTNTISGVTSNWVDDSISGTGGYFVGSNTFADALLIQSGGVLSNGNGYLGYTVSSSDNNVLVAGDGSIWSNRWGLFVGFSGMGNRLVISNGGQVVNNAAQSPNYSCYVGYSASSSNNSVSVSNPTTVWKNGWQLCVGYSGAANSLLISNGGKVFVSGSGAIGYNTSSSNNAALVTESGSSWSNSGALYVGLNGTDNRLTITKGGQLFSTIPPPGGPSGIVGYNSGSSNNRVLISDANSVWNNFGSLYVGNSGSANSLVISNGGRLVDSSSTIGNSSNGSNNSVLITDAGSVWSNANALIIGLQSSGHSLVISNGGRVVNGNGGLGTGFGVGGSRSNIVVVTGSGSVWKNNGTLNMSGKGSANRLIVADGGQVISAYGIVGALDSPNSVLVTNGGMWQCDTLTIGNLGSSNSVVIVDGIVSATNILVGATSQACDNFLQLDSGSLIVTNTIGDAVLEVRRGKFILNGGTLQVDKLVMTNACGLFVRNGGTLIVGSLVLDPALDTDGDGLPNGWEQTYGLDPLSADGNDGANGDPDADGLSNTQEYSLGANPTDSSSPFRIASVAREDDDVRVTWTAVGGETNIVQTALTLSGGYSDLSSNIILTGVGLATTNYLDVGAATNAPARFYRVRLVP